MPVDYDAFRKQSWEDRLAFFNELSAAGKAELVRTHMARWLDEHRGELTGAQIEIVQANIAFVTPELYIAPMHNEMLRDLEQLEARTAALLSREQMRNVLTMHW